MLKAFAHIPQFRAEARFSTWLIQITVNEALMRRRRDRTVVMEGLAEHPDEELKQLDAFVRENTIERFGPVRSVRADWDFGLVLEVAFEGLQRSTRHKSGLAMRFPRINRIRWDKPAREADELETLERLLETMGGG